MHFFCSYQDVISTNDAKSIASNVTVGVAVPQSALDALGAFASANEDSALNETRQAARADRLELLDLLSLTTRPAVPHIRSGTHWYSYRVYVIRVLFTKNVDTVLKFHVAYELWIALSYEFLLLIFVLFNAAVGRPEKPSGAASPAASSGLGTDARATEAEAEAVAEAEADAEVEDARVLPVPEAPPANALAHELVVQVNLLEPAPSVPAPARAFPFALDPFQKHAVALLEQHQNVCSEAPSIHTLFYTFRRD